MTRDVSFSLGQHLVPTHCHGDCYNDIDIGKTIVIANKLAYKNLNLSIFFEPKIFIYVICPPKNVSTKPRCYKKHCTTKSEMT